MDFNVRKMNDCDRDEYFEMSREFYASGAAHAPIDDERRTRFWEEILRGELVKGLLLECDGEIAGYALAACYASKEYGGRVLFLDELFLKENFRGRGLAREFFTAIEREEDIAAIRLEAVRENERAVRLYRSLGYEPLEYMQMIKRIKD